MTNKIKKRNLVLWGHKRGEIDVYEDVLKEGITDKTDKEILDIAEEEFKDYDRFRILLIEEKNDFKKMFMGCV